MLVRDIFTRPAVFVTPETTVREAISKLTKTGFALLPVVDDGGLVVGVISESDAMGAVDDNAFVSEVMTVPVEVVGPTTDVVDLAERMAAKRLRSVPVVELGLLVGMVSRQDLLRSMVDEGRGIASKIRALLDEYAGSRRQWSIDVVNGIVEVSGAFADEAERRLVASLARTVDGVRNVQIVPTAPEHEMAD
ncbi:MAG: CBS domain-containing protein [Nocardiaceae bacterium]|nr:CBS domain-containing protein [Nocardiaceae bacterium]